MKYFFTFKILFIFITNIFAQSHKSDSLYNIINNENLPDTLKVLAKIKLADHYQFQKPDSTKLLAEQAFRESTQIGFIQGVYYGYFKLFFHYYQKGDFDIALKTSFRAEKILISKLGTDNVLVAKIYNNIGIVYRNSGAYSRSLDYHFKCLKIAEKLNVLKTMSSCYNNMGLVYNDQNDFKKALEYYFKKLEIDLKLDRKSSVATCYNNIGLAYYSMNQYEKSLDFQLKGLAICLQENYKEDLCYAYINIGELYAAKGNPKKAIEYLEKGLPTAKETQNLHMELRGYVVFGWCYRLLKSYPLAIKHGKKGLLLAKGYRIKEHSFALKQLYKTYEVSGKINLAYQTIKSFYEIQDSIVNDENRKKALALEANYSFEKEKQIIEFEQEKERVAFEASLENERNIRYSMFIGIFLLMGLLGFAFRSYKIKQKAHIKLKSLHKKISRQHKEVSQQKEIIENAHRNITDSINYAKRIQTAILPPDTEFENFLPNSFVLYKPKDVVSGDFYWLEKKEDKIFFAVADCTGHGVPGALVSVICNSALNRSVREYGLTDPAKILDKTREIVLSEFEKSAREVNDGMDIGLCVLENNTLNFSGAYNPVWIVRESDIIEIKADRQPIGNYSKPFPFNSHSIEVKKKDTIYLFSDGFCDQFGEELNQKFKRKKFRKLLLEINDQPIKFQEELLNTAFEDWKGNFKQIDDVCVIGIRV